MSTQPEGVEKQVTISSKTCVRNTALLPDMLQVASTLCYSLHNQHIKLLSFYVIPSITIPPEDCSCVGPASRCPEAPLSALIDAGITTLVGVLGTDSVSRSQAWARLYNKIALKEKQLQCTVVCKAHKLPVFKRSLQGPSFPGLVLPKALACQHLKLLCNRCCKPRQRSGRCSTERSAACAYSGSSHAPSQRLRGAAPAQESLLAKCRALMAEGLTARHWAGGYGYPPPTITGSAQRDVCLIESCIGVGEIAVSDHRGSVPSAAELARLARRAAGAPEQENRVEQLDVHQWGC